MHHNIYYWLLVLLTFHLTAVLCVSHGDSSTPLNFRPTNLYHVLRFARIREVNNNPRSLPPNVVEETRFLTKEENGRTPLSFTIISWLKSMVEPLAYRRHAEATESAYRRADPAEGTRRAESPSESRKFGSTPPISSASIPKGYFSVSKGVIKFIPMPSTTPRAVTYFVKNNSLVPTYGASAVKDSKAGLAAAARLSDTLPTVIKDPKHRDGFFTVKNGQVRFHPLTANRENLSVSSGTGRRADSTKDFSNNFMNELRLKPQKIANKMSSTLLRAPNKILGANHTSTGAAGSEFQAVTASSVQRLPSVRMDDDTLFVPSSPSLDGQVLFNRMSISDYLRQQQSDETSQKMNDHEEKLNANILLSQMEALYPGFGEIVKDKSQIVIQNVFLTPLVDRMETVNRVTPIHIQIKDRNRLPIVLTSDAALYVPKTAQNNETVVFERFNVEEVEDVDIERHSISLAQIESFYPGFSKLTEQRPSQIIIHTSVLTVRQPTHSSTIFPQDSLWMSQNLPTVRIDNETVFVPSASSANGTLVYSRQNVSGTPSRFRKGSVVSVDQIQVYYPGFGDVAKSQPDQIIINNDFIVPHQGSKTSLPGPSSNRPKVIGGSAPVVTVPSTEVTEEQVRPPISVKNQHQFFTFKPKPHVNLWQHRTTTLTSTTTSPAVTPSSTEEVSEDSEVANETVDVQLDELVKQLLGVPTTTPSTAVPSSTEKMLEQSEAASGEGGLAQVDELVKQLLDSPSRYFSTPSPLDAHGMGYYDSTESSEESNTEYAAYQSSTVSSEIPGSTEVPVLSTAGKVVDITESSAKDETDVSTHVSSESVPSADVLKTESKVPMLTIKPVPIISSSKNGSLNFASLVLAHTAALMAGKPSPFTVDRQPDSMQVSLNPVPQADAMDSIIAQLTGPEGGRDQAQPEAESHVPPPAFLANQVYSIAQSLIENNEDSSQDEGEEVSESAVEAPVTQALVTTIVNPITANGDPSFSTEPEPENLEHMTDSTIINEPIFTLHKERPSSASRPSSEVTDAEPIYSLSDVATSSFHLLESIFSTDTEIALNQLQSMRPMESELVTLQNNASTHDPVLFVTISQGDASKSTNSPTPPDVGDFTVFLTLPPGADIVRTNPPTDIDPTNAKETTLNSSDGGPPNPTVLYDSSTEPIDSPGIQTVSMTHLDTQISDKTANKTAAADEVNELPMSEKNGTINSSTVVYPQYAVDLEEDPAESTSRPIHTTSSESPDSKDVKISKPVIVNTTESMPISYVPTTNEPLSTTTEDTSSSAPTFDSTAANEATIAMEVSTVTHLDKVDLPDSNWTTASFIPTTELLTTQTTPTEIPIVTTTAKTTEPLVPESTEETEPSSRPSNFFTCGSESSDDKSVFVSPKYPEPDVDQGRCTFRLKITNASICQVRVQFNDSRMLLPREGDCIDQYLSVSGSIVIPGVERFCGKNTDQHFYLDLTDPELGDPKSRSVEFHVITKARGYPYRYAVHIQQIDCNSAANEIRAPRGCFQYFPHVNGAIKSFNYDAGQYYNNVNYRICLRSANETCALALAAPDGQFGLHKANSRKVPRNRSGVGSRTCVRDYLFIPAGSRDGKVEAINEERYCGAKLSSLHGDKRPRVIIVPKYSSVYSMEFRTGTPRKFLINNRGPGFRVSFAHIRYCAQSETAAASHLRLDDETKDEFETALERIAATLFDQANESDVDREFSEDFYDSDEEPIAPVRPADDADHHNEVSSSSVHYES